MPITFRPHEVVSTTAIVNIAPMPKATPTGRYVARIGITRSSGANGMNRSTSSRPRCAPRSSTPSVENAWCSAMLVAFGTLLPKTDVVATRPHVTEAQSIR